MSHSPQDLLDATLAAAAPAARRVVGHQDIAGTPSDAFASLSRGIQLVASNRSPASMRDCAQRFGVVSRWIAADDPGLAAELQRVAEALNASASAWPLPAAHAAAE